MTNDHIPNSSLDPRLHNIVKQQPHPLLFVTISGAHLYGFPSPDSDYDLRGVHCLPLETVVGLSDGQLTIEQSTIEDGLEIDLVTHDVKKYFAMVLKRNGYVLEQIFSPLIVQTSPEHAELKEIAQRCITRHHAHHYLGFANTQWRLFQKEEPKRVKPLLYVFRVLLTGIYLMQTGKVEANLVTLNQIFQIPHLDSLVHCKVRGTEQATLGTADLPFFAQEFARLVQRLETEQERSTLPDTPVATADLNDLLVRIRLQIATNRT
ncbi:MAG: nucleotidyltransferase domain-containing protein [Caldilineaceae bacterium]|nr:nucleotidyltransferase domain-containing protein [Caldilineaceae bacterium]